MQFEGATILGFGAPIPEGTRATVDSEHGGATRGDRDRVASRTGCGACLLVDNEVLPFEATGHGRCRRPGLDGALVLGLAQGTERLTGSIGTVAQNLESGLLASQELDAG